jgi:hypothetical protein
MLQLKRCVWGGGRSDLQISLRERAMMLFLLSCDALAGQLHISLFCRTADHLSPPTRVLSSPS